METSALKAFAKSLSIGLLVEAAVVLAFTWALVWVLKFLLDGLAERFARYRLIISGLFPVLRLVAWAFAVGFIVFGILQPSENVVLALGASAGIALGLAAQDVMRNALAGVMMMFDRPFQAGDMIQVGPHYGEVISIRMNTVRLRTFNDDVVTIPSAEVMKQAVVNSNAGGIMEMITVAFTVPATVEAQSLKEMAWEAAASSPYTYLKRPIVVAVEDHFDRAFLSRFLIKVYVLDVRLERLLASDVTQRVKRELVARNLIREDPLWVTAEYGAAGKKA